MDVIKAQVVALFTGTSTSGNEARLISQLYYPLGFPMPQFIGQHPSPSVPSRLYARLATHSIRNATSHASATREKVRNGLALFPIPLTAKVDEKPLVAIAAAKPDDILELFNIVRILNSRRDYLD